MAKAAITFAVVAFCAFVSGDQSKFYPTNFAYPANYGYPGAYPVNYGSPANFAYPPNPVYTVNIFYPTHYAYPPNPAYPPSITYPNNSHSNNSITTVKPLGRLDFCVPMRRGGLDCTYRYDTYDYGCQNIYATEKAIGFDTHGKCMFLFEDRDCKGWYFWAWPSPDKLYAPIANRTLSYRLCKAST